MECGKIEKKYNGTHDPITRALNSKCLQQLNETQKPHTKRKEIAIPRIGPLFRTLRIRELKMDPNNKERRH